MLDTSYVTNFCYNKEQKINEDIKQKFDLSIANIISDNRTKWFEGDYEQVVDSYSFVELIGLGISEVIEPNREKFESCFTFADEIVFLFELHKNKENILRIVIDRFLCNAFEALISFFKKYIVVQEIIKKANEALVKKQFHEHVNTLKLEIEEWVRDLEKNGKESINFEDLCVSLAWDMLVRRIWVLNIVEDLSIKHYFAIENQINLRLCRYYFDLKNEETNVPGAILFCKLDFNPNSKKAFISRPKYYKSEGDLLDARFIEYLVMGYFERPVIVLSCEKSRVLQEKRIGLFINSLRSICLRLHLQLTFIPGFLVLIDQKTNLVSVIDVTEEIKKYLLSDTKVQSLLFIEP